MSTNWDLELPDGAVQEGYYTSEHGPHGEREDVYVAEMDEAPTSGFWSVDEFDDSLDEEGKQLAGSIIEDSGAPADDFDLDELRCQDTMHDPDDEENILLPCFDPEADRYVIFERLV